MRSIVTVTEPATLERLTTVERVQADLGITSNYMAVEVAIDEASSRIQAELGYHLALETVTETWRPINGYGYADSMVLSRTPVVEIESITMDATALVEGEWWIDLETGLLSWLNGTGISTPWKFCTALSVAYSGGWVMPGEDGRTLPPAIEAAAVAYCRSLLASRTRDPMLRSVEIPGVITRDYYSPSRAGGEKTPLPPDVASMLGPFKRLHV